MGTDEAMESELGLGELAGLTVANEADSLTYDVSRTTEEDGYNGFLKFKGLSTFLSHEKHHPKIIHGKVCVVPVCAVLVCRTFNGHFL